MPENDFHGPQQLASDFVLHTAANVFVTGKAGTGKTTFLHSIRHNTIKNTVVAAPTGVAAINAGGVTLHSLFQLPFGMFLPTTRRVPEYAVNKNTVFEQLRLGKAKIELIKELELLIIDEVSMLRCDTLDCIDTILRTVRKRPSDPFGGIQVLFIGDLFQLPPVVNDSEWRVMNEYYETPFFFSAHVIGECDILNIEFDKIYRQNEQRFINLLNKVRNNEMAEDDFYLLNDRYTPEEIGELENFITLTTHNYKADKINQSELSKLDADPYEFTANVEGDFSEKAYPTEEKLVLKVGAQVMFIKNDSSIDKRYFNGKLATIIKISAEEIVVRFLNEEIELTVEKETWENIRYAYNPATDKIEEDKIGSFVQYPLRLAWAITIHKSQGLTFDKAVIDAGQAFAAGQVYVALSRCTNMDGMYLLTRISQAAITTDERIVDFTQRQLHNEDELSQQLPFKKIEFAKVQLLKAFDWNKTVDMITAFVDMSNYKMLPDKEKALDLALEMEKKARAQKEIADKFSRQLQDILKDISTTEAQQLLQDRVVKSIHYFGKALAEEFIKPLRALIRIMETKKRVRGFLVKANELEHFLSSKLKQIERLQFGGEPFYTGEAFVETTTLEKFKALEKSKLPKIEKGDSQKITLRLYKEGKKIDEIAAERSMAASTIEGHLSQFITTGEVDVHDFISEKNIEEIRSFIGSDEVKSITPLKEHFEEKYTYGQLRLAVAFLSRKETAI